MAAGAERVLSQRNRTRSSAPAHSSESAASRRSTRIGLWSRLARADRAELEDEAERLALLHR